GYDHTCGVKTDGTVACWGSNTYGKATPPAGTFRSVSAGFDHTCGVKTDGSVACWGDNGLGEATPPAGTFL
ncbi:MAG TPA: RCC1 domain-containing protein, partial [Labilithrix sp.]|nr:RCC1 domain-containing protein [Labilithrix sp.]